MSALADTLEEMNPGGDTLHDDEDLVLVWAGGGFAMLTRCTDTEAPEHWHGALHTDLTIRSSGKTAADACAHLYARYLEMTTDALSTDASERSPSETPGRPGVADVPDNHARDGG